MIYIEKSQEPDSLKIFNEKQKINNIAARYNGLDNQIIGDLRQKLVNAQGGLCCYCMSRITAQNSDIEHFLPETGFEDEQTVYSNLFLACRYSKGKKTEYQHCDTSPGAKANKLIPKYISDPNCHRYFQYNESGEILPYGDFKTYQRFLQNYIKLNAEQKMILATIEILNLNEDTLKKQRKKVADVIITEVQGLTEQQIKEEIQKYRAKNDNKLVPFCGVTLYFLTSYLRRRFPSS